MGTIILPTALRRRVRTLRTSLPEFFIRFWIGMGLALAATVIILVIASTLALALFGVALLADALPWAALLALCVTILAAAVARVSRGL